MKNKTYRSYYIWSCLGVLLVSFYPLLMLVRVVLDMLIRGEVLKENYPKYIIPYTPISLAVLVGVIFMPLLFSCFKRFAFWGGGAIASGVFFWSETLLEQKVVISSPETVSRLQDWQMLMCYVPVGETTIYKTKTAVEILMGDYSPTFKIHFYIISIVLILCILNCLYGFGHMIRTGETKRKKVLVLQSVCTGVFLGLCILACFTAFWRDGNIRVSALSAILMSMFFVLLGVTVGAFVGSFLLEKKKSISVGIPAVVASLLTLGMYMAEMCLLNGHLYIFGSGLLFDSIRGIVLAPVDLILILASGGITAGLFAVLCRKNK